MKIHVAIKSILNVLCDRPKKIPTCVSINCTTFSSFVISSKLLIPFTGYHEAPPVLLLLSGAAALVPAIPPMVLFLIVFFKLLRPFLIVMAERQVENPPTYADTSEMRNKEMKLRALMVSRNIMAILVTLLELNCILWQNCKNVNKECVFVLYATPGLTSDAFERVSKKLSSLGIHVYFIREPINMMMSS